MFIMRAPVERAAERQEWAASVDSLQRLRDDVQLAIEAGLLRTGDPESAVFAFWSLLHGAMALLLGRGRRVRLGADSDRAVATWQLFGLHGFRPAVLHSDPRLAHVSQG
jgi:hypothetical protein